MVARVARVGAEKEERGGVSVKGVVARAARVKGPGRERAKARARDVGETGSGLVVAGVGGGGAVDRPPRSSPL
jgi:hypothetical protein